MRRKRIMILGAGLFQLAAIKKAVELGYEVITVDNLPDNIGHRHSHKSINRSTTDIPGVVAAAKDERVDAIFTMASDVALPAVAAVCSELGLPGPAPEVVERLCRKDLFRDWQQKSGLTHPKHGSAASIADLIKFQWNETNRVVVKPTDTSGSRGVTTVDPHNINAMSEAFAYAHQFSRSGWVIAEEHVGGVEVGAEGIVVGGKIQHISFTHKFLRGFVVMGHRLPTNITPDQQDGATDTLQKHFTAQGYKEGPFNADIKLAPGRIVVLEMSTRLGGNGIPLLIRRHTGVDLIELSLRLAMGEQPSVPAPIDPGIGCGSLIIGCGTSGKLVGISSEDEVKAALPWVFECALGALPGMHVARHEHGGNTIGFVLFDTDSGADYLGKTDRIQQDLNIQVVTDA